MNLTRGVKMGTRNLFVNHLKTYKAKDLHSDCAVVKRKKVDMAIREIENLVWLFRWRASSAKDDLEEIDRVIQRLRG